MNRRVVPPEWAQQVQVPRLFAMFVNPPVAFPAYGNPVRLVQQEHAATVLIMVTLESLAHAGLARADRHDTSGLRQPQPLLDPGPVNAFLLEPGRCAAGDRA